MIDYKYDNYYPYSYGYIPSFTNKMNATMHCQKLVETDLYTYPQNFYGSLDLIRQAVSSEDEDRGFYTWLMDQAPSEEDVQIITGIRDNEVVHSALFRQIYYDLTGITLPQPEEEELTRPGTYCEGLAQALLSEQNAIQKYRNIFYAMQSRIHINMLIEIITDEIRHGILCNYLYSKNSCGGGNPSDALE